MTDTIPTTVAITGAGGSLGKALAKRLLEDGHRVKALVRKEDDARQLRRLGAEPVSGDVRESAALEELVEDCRLVFHLAAWMGTPFDEELARAVNVGGTEKVVTGSGRAGVGRVVLASSIAVYGPVQKGVVTEESPTRSVGDLYGDTKIEGEKAARREAERAGVELAILRPTMIYGPESPSWTEIPFDSISKGLPVVIGTGEDLADPVFVEDVARAFELAAFVPEAAGETFNVGAGPATWNEFLGFYARMVGKSLRRIPAPLARSGARAAEKAQRAVGRRPPVVSEMVGVMTSRASFSHGKASRVLGFQSGVYAGEGHERDRSLAAAFGPPETRLGGAGYGCGGGTRAGDGHQTEGRGRYGVGGGPGAAGGPRRRPPSRAGRNLGRQHRGSCGADRSRGDPVDLLVNVAGLAKPDALEQQDFADVEVQFDVNAYGPLKLARAVTPGMRRRGWGRVVNVSSTNGFVVTPFMGAYSASKYALEALSDALRMELKPWGIEVVLVAPGAMKTAFAEKAQAVLRGRIATGREGWSGYLESFLESPLWGTENATSPEKVAEFIARTALSRRAPARRLATLDAIPAKVMSVLPTAVRDAFFVRASGLHRPPGDKAASRQEDRTGR